MFWEFREMKIKKRRVLWIRSLPFPEGFRQEIIMLKTYTQ
jgi:hypothetical protein